jgi:hypothetical protein
MREIVSDSIDCAPGVLLDPLAAVSLDVDDRPLDAREAS